MNIEEIKKAVRKLDPKLKGNEAEFRAACCVLDSAINKHKTAGAVTRATGLPKKEVELYLVNLWANGLGWQKDGTFRHGGWFGKGTGGIAFWLDVGCATGIFERSPNVTQDGAG